MRIISSCLACSSPIRLLRLLPGWTCMTSDLLHFVFHILISRDIVLVSESDEIEMGNLAICVREKRTPRRGVTR